MTVPPGRVYPKRPVRQPYSRLVRLKYSSSARVRGANRDRSVLKLVSDPKAQQVWSDLLVAIFITVEWYIDGSIGQQV